MLGRGGLLASLCSRTVACRLCAACSALTHEHTKHTIFDVMLQAMEIRKPPARKTDGRGFQTAQREPSRLRLSGDETSEQHTPTKLAILSWIACMRAALSASYGVTPSMGAGADRQRGMLQATAGCTARTQHKCRGTNYVQEANRAPTRVSRTAGGRRLLPKAAQTRAHSLYEQLVGRSITTSSVRTT